MWVGIIPKPQGLLVELLFGPGQFVWPVDSETQLAKDAETLGQEEKFHEEQALEARRYARPGVQRRGLGRRERRGR